MSKFTSANAVALLSTGMYFVLMLLAYVWFSNMKFSGDAAGKGMAIGFTFLYGLVFFVVLALIIAFSSLYFQKRFTVSWIKYVPFIPLLSIVLIFVVSFMGRGYASSTSTSDQAHKLSFEVKSSKALEEVQYWVRTSSGGSGGKPRNALVKEGEYVYQFSSVIYREYERSANFGSADFEVNLDINAIPELPNAMPFSEWKSIRTVTNDSLNELQLQYRYRVEKMPDLLIE